MEEGFAEAYIEISEGRDERAHGDLVSTFDLDVEVRKGEGLVD